MLIEEKGLSDSWFRIGGRFSSEGGENKDDFFREKKEESTPLLRRKEEKNFYESMVGGKGSHEPGEKKNFLKGPAKEIYLLGKEKKKARRKGGFRSTWIESENFFLRTERKKKGGIGVKK